jgi:hypothetical protein
MVLNATFSNISVIYIFFFNTNRAANPPGIRGSLPIFDHVSRPSTSVPFSPEIRFVQKFYKWHLFFLTGIYKIVK